MKKLIRKRRRNSKTDYRSRAAMLKGGMPRLVVRKSNRAVTVQLIEYDSQGDRTVAIARSAELKSKGWEPRCNIPTAYLTGMLLAGKSKGSKEAVLDIGLARPIKGSVVFAAAKGFQDAGGSIRGSIEFEEKRLSGEHIGAYAGINDKMFSAYAKAGFDARNIKTKFDDIRSNLKK